jgi:hypothetical protein
MNWRAAIRWAALSLITWFILVGTIGLLASTVIQQRYDLGDIPLGQAGVLVPVVISIGLLPRLAPGFLLGTMIWSLLARRIPQIEATRKSLVGFLSVYSLAAGGFVWLALPLNQPFALFGGVLFMVCLFSPRFLSQRLYPGVFSI